MIDSLKTYIEADHAAREEQDRLLIAAQGTKIGSKEWDAYRYFDGCEEARENLKRALREAIGLD